MQSQSIEEILSGPLIGVGVSLSQKQERLKCSNNKLNRLFSRIDFSYGIFEFGVPNGSLARIIPFQVLNSFEKRTVLITDKSNKIIYPPSLATMGYTLDQIQVIQSSEPIRDLKTILTEDAYKCIVIDSSERISKADFNLFFSLTRTQKIKLFIFRGFYLSNKNGNSFCKLRVNSSYDIMRNTFKLNLIKGIGKKSLTLKSAEVMNE
ncbi:MAG: hypothetical protein HRT44_02430 [Bdellovibrionales bacterium]|nr:hypothetical protein [Bdellovibrionales bacterium]NQZ18104.1 hypothetical protein [Bdellovibrionales bacterium]